MLSSIATHGNSNLNGCTANKFKIQILSHTNDSSSVQWPSDWTEDIAIITEGSTGQHCSWGRRGCQARYLGQKLGRHVGEKSSAVLAVSVISLLSFFWVWTCPRVKTVAGCQSIQGLPHGQVASLLPTLKGSTRPLWSPHPRLLHVARQEEQWDIYRFRPSVKDRIRAGLRCMSFLGRQTCWLLFNWHVLKAGPTFTQSRCSPARERRGAAGSCHEVSLGSRACKPPAVPGLLLPEAIPHSC